ncbi:MAG: hypothetical protein N4A74_07925 [Carboxylicivirga sp.]|jgi:uncharacterized protein YbjT (DUF2867 family)|nr:hypothetical protein [Carboxylicivirga sp.]
MKFKAVVIGATGLVGSCLVNDLIADENCLELRVIVRRAIGFKHPKLIECIIDFDGTFDYARNVKGDVLFSCLGTTRSQAGSKANQYKVDFTYQLMAAKSAKENSVLSYVLVSSPFAHADSGNYYRRMKAELEKQVQELSFDKITILKPNLLVGDRRIKRNGEVFAAKVLLHLIKLFPKLNKYKPMKGENVAKAMLKAYYRQANHNDNLTIYSRNEINLIRCISQDLI